MLSTKALSSELALNAQKYLPIWATIPASKLQTAALEQLCLAPAFVICKNRIWYEITK